MYADLPEQLQQIVREYLLADDFKTAKAIHDKWLSTGIATFAENIPASQPLQSKKSL